MSCEPPLIPKSSNSRYSPRKIKKNSERYLQSRIGSHQSIVTESPIKKSNCISSFDSGVWKSTIFPRPNPDERNDVLLLDDWITESLSSLPQRKYEGQPWSESSAKLAQEQLKIMDLGFSEITRQVALECSQRSELMSRLWHSSHEIFEKLISEMTNTIDSLRVNANDWQQKYHQLQRELDAQEWRHSQELKQIKSQSKTNKSEDSIIYREMQEEIYNREKDMRLMENILADLSIWFPNFNSYSTSVLRKHLPSIEDCSGLILRYGQTIEQTEKDTILPQDLLYQDLKRLEKLDIGFYIAASTSKDKQQNKNQNQDEESQISSSSNENINYDQINDVSYKDPNALRTLLFENQLQSVVVEELQNKYSNLIEKYNSDQKNSKNRIESLLFENYSLKDKLEGNGPIFNLPKFEPMLQLRGIPSVSTEILTLWYSRKTLSYSPPAQLISIGDLQKFLVIFTNSFLHNISPPCWTLYPKTKTFLGRQLPIEKEQLQLLGTFGGISGIELKLMNFETLVSYYLIIQKKSIRAARETLRRIIWSVWIWSQQSITSSSSTYLSRFQSTVDGLPRNLLEYEKGIILTMMYAFGLSRHEGNSSDENKDDEEFGHEKAIGMTSIFLSIYIKCFAAMKRFIKTNSKAFGIGSSTSTNLFLTGLSSPIPVNEIDRILARVFNVSQLEASYRRPSTLNIDQLQENPEEKVLNDHLVEESWWCYLPSKVAIKIREDIMLLLQKNAGTFVESFDIILTIWTHIKTYRESLFIILEELYKYLAGSIGSVSEPIFQSLILIILEKKSPMIGPHHKVLPLELISMSANETLTSSTFAETILKKGYPLSGLHILFDAGPRTKREIRKEGEKLFTELTNYFTSDKIDPIFFPDLSISSDAIMRHAQLHFDTFAPQEQTSTEMSEKMIIFLPEIYFSLQSMKFLKNMIESTEGIANFLNLNQEAKATQFRKISLLQRTLVSWKQQMDGKNDEGQSDSEGEEELDEDEDKDKENYNNKKGILESLQEDEEDET